MEQFHFPILNRLTSRQRTIIELRAQGLRHKEIGERTGLAEGTVKIYWGRDILNKLGLKDTHEIIPEYRRLERLDYMRVKAIALNGWLRKHGDSISPEARFDLQCIMAEMVQEIRPDTLPARTDQSPVPSETARSDRYTRPELRPVI
jgi:DNA-binding CsgD family transcriptional regulator